MAVDDQGNEIINNEPSDAERRITSLSGKVKETSKERDDARAAAEAANAAATEALRERDFYAGFADVISTNPQAKDHKDEILTKVKGGYSVEDATYAVLGKAGKLGQTAPDTGHIAGGSATTSTPQGGKKPVNEMSRDEKRAALMDAEKSGEISLS